MNSDLINISGIWAMTNVTLETNGNQSDDAVVRLAVYAILAIIGTMLNVLQISALIVQYDLHHSRNTLIANNAISHMIITLVVYSRICIDILSRNSDKIHICHWSWYGSLLTFLTVTFNYLAIALESFVYTHKFSYHTKQLFSGKKYIIINIVSIWLISLNSITFIIIKNKLDICKQSYYNNSLYLLILSPIILTLILFIKSLHSLKVQNDHLPSNDNELTKKRFQYKLLKSNSIAFLLFLIQWLPLIFTILLSEPNGVWYSAVENLLILAQSHSCFWSLCYVFSNHAFHQAFARNIRYFCFKSHVECSKTLQEKPYGSVRVHIGMETRVGERNQKFDNVLSAMLPNEMPQAKSELDFL
ncbi:melatonin receptor type 1A-like [Centruroides sculpturatus]|uniref:melatonin receptor type 1A-like n=1 Tax=Centruroides sculpturatus TaxID=218467 RepID=UPI000C6D3D6C|nr:melatonin receptor type 1A-like [Centruroides sculpturatus]XP_023231687.1 melatonin receptor type 1A-like [Centruroides sculpturatus]